VAKPEQKETFDTDAFKALPDLFVAYPELIGRLPWMPLGDFPTPVERLKNCGCDNLWIKREDLSSRLYSGNKTRKLEIVLADVLARGKKVVVTMGGIGTNHGLATAIYCNHLGLGCRLLLFDQPVTPYVKQNMLLFRRYGAEMVYCKTILRAGLAYYLTEKIRNPKAYFLYAGGSSPLGTAGIVSAMFELKQQIARGEMPSPRYIFCPLGSNGTVAGLSLGALLAGIDTTVIGVGVSVDSLGPLPIANATTVRALMKDTYSILRALAPSIPRMAMPPQRVIGNYLGDGYGYPTAACRDAMGFLKEREGIQLDPTYTAKTFAAVRDFVASSSRKDEPVLYWHTYNSVDLSAEAASVDYRELPSKFHRFFTMEEYSV
jgi:1-aminocyclopropane-1-carboxylate deaminase/D-cysteine desulfhydrase-like pyridoxal-dependent ACC family enzyme